MAVFCGTWTRVVLFVAYVPTLVHAVRGSKYRTVIWLVSLLLVSNLTIVGFYRFYKQIFIDNSLTTSSIWGYAITDAVGNLCFLVSHFELAWTYRRIAGDTPMLLNEELTVMSEDDAKSRVWYWVLMASNCLIPVLQFIGYVVYLSAYKTSNVTEADKWLLNVATLGGDFLLIVSGFYLISSVVKIRKELIENGTPNILNTKNMLLHGSAFGIFLLSVSEYAVAETLLIFNPKSQSL
jgi:hypothetical protein